MNYGNDGAGPTASNVVSDTYFGELVGFQTTGAQWLEIDEQETGTKIRRVNFTYGDTETDGVGSLWAIEDIATKQTGIVMVTGTTLTPQEVAAVEETVKQIALN